jgi:hypothetical protein
MKCNGSPEGGLNIGQKGISNTGPKYNLDSTPTFQVIQTQALFSLVPLCWSHTVALELNDSPVLFMLATSTVSREGRGQRKEREENFWIGEVGEGNRAGRKSRYWMSHNNGN